MKQVYGQEGYVNQRFLPGLLKRNLPLHKKIEEIEEHNNAEPNKPSKNRSCEAWRLAHQHLNTCDEDNTVLMVTIHQFSLKYHRGLFFKSLSKEAYKGHDLSNKEQCAIVKGKLTVIADKDPDSRIAAIRGDLRRKTGK